MINELLKRTDGLPTLAQAAILSACSAVGWLVLAYCAVEIWG